MRTLLLAIFCLPLWLFGQNEKRDLLHFGLKAAIENADPQAKLPVYLRGEAMAVTSFIRNNGGTVRGTFNGFVATALPLSAFAKIADAPGIDYVEFSPWKPEALTDVVLPNNNVVAVHQGLSPLPQAYLGNDVVLGFIDTGIELNHPDFQHADGSTRVIALWDHTQPPTDLQRVPQPYNYGQEWNAEDIDAGLSNHGDQAQYFGHGSTVTGVAVGNANATGDFLGIAPQSDIIVVSSNFNAPHWNMTVADAVEWIFERAEAIGKPAVVNASLGNYLGSHDALDAAALHIESLLDAAPGRAMVCAAGNGNAWDPYHLGYQIPEVDTAFTWFSYNPSALGTGAVFIEAWADIENFENTRFTIGADVVSPAYAFRGYASWRSAASALNQVVQDTIFYNGAIIGVVQSWVGQRGDQYQIQMVVTQPFSTQHRFRFATTGGGRFDCWSRQAWGLSNIQSTNLPSAATYPPMSKYRMPDKLMGMVDSWACSDKVITVANYANQSEFLNYGGTTTVVSNAVTGQLAASSSSGPTRDFRQKPEIAATGDVILSAGRLSEITAMINSNSQSLAFSGMHYTNGGTSMASPVVAAAVALYFERCPQATYADAKEALVSTAIADPFTGVLPGNRWGHGKLDVFGMINSSVQNVAISLPPVLPCEGTEGQLVADASYSDYLWNNGSTGAVLVTSTPGTYTVQAFDDKGCLQTSPAMALNFLESPDQPFILFENGSLLAMGDADLWQWFLEENPVANATEAEFVPAEIGIYTVEAIAENGCGSLSEPYFYGVTSTSHENEVGFQLYPNPTGGDFSLSANENLDRVAIFDLSGRKVFEQPLGLSASQSALIHVAHLPAALYIVSVTGGSEIYNLKLAIEK
jgi:subtilisin family serine protease